MVLPLKLKKPHWFHYFYKAYYQIELNIENQI